MVETIFHRTIRAFFTAFASLLGIAIGLIPLFLVFIILGALVSSTSEDMDQHYSVEIVPNADNVRKKQSSSSPVILKLNIEGFIGSELFNSSTIAQQLVESREGDLKNNRVKALILHINTPGGSAFDSDNIYRAIKRYKAQYKVPVYAYVDGLCASGGMYIACSADKIFSSETGVIGSVGVIGPSAVNVSKLLSTFGVESLTLSAGKGKDELNPLRPWKPDEGQSLQELFNAMYDQFATIVSDNRKMDKKTLIDVYGANVFIANQAKEYGYIDESNYSFNEALKLLLKEIGIEDDYYQVVQLESTNWLLKLLKSDSSMLSGKVVHKLELPTELDPAYTNQFLYLYRP